MPQFQSSFNPHDPRHRIQMHQTMRALSIELNTGMKHSKINFLAHAKALGWVPQRCQKKTALRSLVEQAKKGFGFVPSKTIKQALGEEECNDRSAKDSGGEGQFPARGDQAPPQSA